jgi:hypothetical protein
MKFYVSILVTFGLLIGISNESELVGHWKLVSYDAIDVIRLSDGYQYADDITKEEMEKMFDMTFDSTYYEFGKDTLKYSSVEIDDKVFHRRAIWKLIGDTLMIKEIDRIYFRKALVRSVDEKELVISPIIDDVVGKSKMVFSKVK